MQCLSHYLTLRILCPLRKTGLFFARLNWRVSTDFSMALVVLTCLILSQNIACSVMLRSACIESFTYLQRGVGRHDPQEKTMNFSPTIISKTKPFLQTWIDLGNERYRDDNIPFLRHYPPGTFYGRELISRLNIQLSVGWTWVRSGSGIWKPFIN
jgi:hypothetical protein